MNFDFLLARPLLSCLSACYAFAAKHRHQHYPMWLLGLIFTVERNLSSPANPEVHLGDSSDRGYGLVRSTFAESSHVKAELRVREKWRFIVSNEAVLNPNGGGPPEVLKDVDDDVFKGSFAAAGVGVKTEYGRQLQKKADGGSIFGTNSSRLERLKGPVEDSLSTLLEVHAIPEVSSRWTNPTRWKLLASGAWRDVEEHINVKEARVALMSLRRLGEV